MPPGGLEFEIILACNGQGYATTTGWNNSVPTACNGLQDTGGDTGGADQTCVGWNPASRVTLSGGVRRVSKSFIDQLAASPFALTECDGARLERQTTGGYKIVNATTATLLYQLGLRNNDVVLKINNQTLNSMSEAAKRYADLYLAGNVLSYSLQIRRNGTLQTLSYAVDP